LAVSLACFDQRGQGGDTNKQAPSLAGFAARQGTRIEDQELWCGIISADLTAGKTETGMDLIAQLEAEQIAALGKTIPDFKAGDTLRVGYKVTEGTRSRVQAYEGVCISRKGGATISASFTVRKISFGEGVERIFPLYSTNIEMIEVIRRGRVRRAKLYYLRDRRGKSARIAENSSYKAKAE